MCGVWKAVAIKPDTCEHCHTYSHLFLGVWRWRNDTTQFVSGHKELGLVWKYVAKQLNWSEDQLNRFLALHALVEGLGMCWATFGLKVPILLNWVRFRPGIWDSGAISSTGWGAVYDRAPTWGCLGLAPIRGSKQCGMDILPIFQLRLGSNLLIWMASLASLVIWQGSLSIMLKSSCQRWKVMGGGNLYSVVFLDHFAKSPRGFSDVGWVARIYLTFPMVDYVLLLVGRDFVFGMH